MLIPNIDSIIIQILLSNFMSRWDDRNFENYNRDGIVDEEEESRLLKKFRDYRELEKNEIEKKRFLEYSNNKNLGIWNKRFIISAIVQGSIIAALTISLLFVEILYSDFAMMEMLSISFEGPAKWFFFGYIMNMTLVVGIAVTAVFYNNLEVNLKKEVNGFKKILAWIHFIGMNVGGTVATFLMIWVGLAGSGVTSFITSQKIIVTPQPNIMEEFMLPIGGFIALLAIGMLAGGVAFLSLYLQKKSNKEFWKNFSSHQYENEKTEFDKI